MALRRTDTAQRSGGDFKVAGCQSPLGRMGQRVRQPSGALLFYTQDHWGNAVSQTLGNGHGGPVGVTGGQDRRTLGQPLPQDRGEAILKKDQRTSPGPRAKYCIQPLSLFFVQKNGLSAKKVLLIGVFRRGPTSKSFLTTKLNPTRFT